MQGEVEIALIPLNPPLEKGEEKGDFRKGGRIEREFIKGDVEGGFGGLGWIF